MAAISGKSWTATAIAPRKATWAMEFVIPGAPLAEPISTAAPLIGTTETVSALPAVQIVGSEMGSATWIATILPATMMAATANVLPDVLMSGLATAFAIPCATTRHVDMTAVIVAVMVFAPSVKIANGIRIVPTHGSETVSVIQDAITRRAAMTTVIAVRRNVPPDVRMDGPATAFVTTPATMLRAILMGETAVAAVSALPGVRPTGLVMVGATLPATMPHVISTTEIVRRQNAHQVVRTVGPVTAGVTNPATMPPAIMMAVIVVQLAIVVLGIAEDRHPMVVIVIPSVCPQETVA